MIPRRKLLPAAWLRAGPLPGGSISLSRRPCSGAEAALSEVIVGLNDLAQTLLGGPVPAIGVRMVPFHKFLIPCLDLVQGRGRRQIERIKGLLFQRTRLSPRFCGFRALMARSLIKKAKTIAKRRTLAGARGEMRAKGGFGSIYAKAPGRAVACQGIALESRDFGIAHAFEEIIALVELANMRFAEPGILLA